jgi:hypothetical protein
MSTPPHPPRGHPALPQPWGGRRQNQTPHPHVWGTAAQERWPHPPGRWPHPREASCPETLATPGRPPAQEVLLPREASCPGGVPAAPGGPSTPPGGLLPRDAGHTREASCPGSPPAQGGLLPRGVPAAPGGPATAPGGLLPRDAGHTPGGLLPRKSSCPGRPPAPGECRPPRGGQPLPHGVTAAQERWPHPGAAGGAGQFGRKCPGTPVGRHVGTGVPGQ